MEHVITASDAYGGSQIRGFGMGEIIDLRSRAAEACAERQTPEFEKFLVEEGLDLLAAFRSIPEVSVRASIVELVAKISAVY